MSYLLRAAGYLIRKSGILVSAHDEDCNCCGGGTCLSCIYCESCVEADRPGCPTGICCTPDEIEVVIAGVDAAMCNCFQVWDSIFSTLETNSRAKLVNPPSIDGTYNLAQVSECRWEHTFNISPSTEVDIYSGAGCTGSVVGGGSSSSSITLALVRSGATTWQFQIYDSVGNTYFGTNPGNGGDGGAVSETATEDDCKNIPVISNGIGTCSINDNSMQACLSTGGTATFTVCPGGI